MSRAIRIAIPKGRLAGPALERFEAAGYDVPTRDDLSSRRLVFERGGIEWILVKDGDVPVYVEHGAADAGVAGLDQILEHESNVYQPIAFDFGRCRMMLIGARGASPFAASTAGGIATKYPNITRRWLAGRGLHAEIVALQGSVELAAVLNLTPYIVDLVETGETVRIHGLSMLEEIAEIGPRLIVNRSAYRLQNGAMRRMIGALGEASETGRSRSGSFVAGLITREGEAGRAPQDDRDLRRSRSGSFVAGLIAREGEASRAPQDDRDLRRSRSGSFVAGLITREGEASRAPQDDRGAAVPFEGEIA